MKTLLMWLGGAFMGASLLSGYRQFEVLTKAQAQGLHNETHDVKSTVCTVGFEADPILRICVPIDPTIMDTNDISMKAAGFSVKEQAWHRIVVDKNGYVICSKEK